MGINQELINRINELSKKKKAGTITEEELALQKELRKEYLEAFRGNMRGILDNTDFLKEFKVSKFNTNKKELALLDNEDRVVRIEEKATEFIITYKMKEISELEIIRKLKGN